MAGATGRGGKPVPLSVTIPSLTDSGLTVPHSADPPHRDEKVAPAEVILKRRRRRESIGVGLSDQINLVLAYLRAGRETGAGADRGAGALWTKPALAPRQVRVPEPASVVSGLARVTLRGK
jgi:hypothetical protein